MPSPCGVGVPWHPDGPQSLLDDLRVVTQAKAPTQKLDLKLVDDDDAGVLDGLESEEAEVQEEEKESALGGQGSAPEGAFEPKPEESVRDIAERKGEGERQVKSGAEGSVRGPNEGTTTDSDQEHSNFKPEAQRETEPQYRGPWRLLSRPLTPPQWASQSAASAASFARAHTTDASAPAPLRFRWNGNAKARRQPLSQDQLPVDEGHDTDKQGVSRNKSRPPERSQAHESIDVNRPLPVPLPLPYAIVVPLPSTPPYFTETSVAVSRKENAGPSSSARARRPELPEPMPKSPDWWQGDGWRKPPPKS